MTIERDKIERVINVFSEFIDATPDIDVALTRKNGYVLLTDNSYSEPIRTGQEMCEAMLHEMEMEFRVVKNIELPVIPDELRSELVHWMQRYMIHLPEYQELMEQYH